MYPSEGNEEAHHYQHYSSNDQIITLTMYFFFNDTATTEIYTLSLHDALPILARNNLLQELRVNWFHYQFINAPLKDGPSSFPDRKSTRLNSSHLVISYAVFCLTKYNADAFALPVSHTGASTARFATAWNSLSG